MASGWHQQPTGHMPMTFTPPRDPNSGSMNWENRENREWHNSSWVKQEPDGFKWENYMDVQGGAMPGPSAKPSGSGMPGESIQVRSKTIAHF